MRDIVRKLLPNFLLDWNRLRKKKSHFAQLQHKQRTGKVITQAMLEHDLKEAGIVSGDVLLVHSSLSKIGYVENGPETVVNALLSVVGKEGHLLMPNSPNGGLQKKYIEELIEFDVLNSKSALGAISEHFRLLPGSIRSEHPTEPVSCFGPKANYFVDGHFGQLTPYNENSPFYKVSEASGKILYVGVTLDNAGTNLHTLEDAVKDFEYPVYSDEIYEVGIKGRDGEVREMKTKVHNPAQSAKRKCDSLIPLFEKKGVLKKVKIGEANSLLVDAMGMLEVMIKEYNERGVTMYTPSGK